MRLQLDSVDDDNPLNHRVTSGGLDPRALGVAIDGLAAEVCDQKSAVIAHLVAGMRKGLQVGNRVLVENAAVYLWNLHLHVFEKRCFGKAMPRRVDALEEAFQALMRLRQ